MIKVSFVCDNKLQSERLIAVAKEFFEIEETTELKQCQCAVLDERWLCQACGHCWYDSLTREGCPNCGADIDHIDMRNDLVGDIQGKQA